MQNTGQNFNNVVKSRSAAQGAANGQSQILKHDSSLYKTSDQLTGINSDPRVKI